MHALTGLTTVIASLVSAMIKFPYAKIMDIWGRPQAFGIGVGLLTLGLVMMLMLIIATCLYLITWTSCLFWRDLNVKKMKQQVHGSHF